MIAIKDIQLPHDPTAIIAFIGYLFAVIMVGLVAFIATRNLSDYVLGGRRLGGAVAALSAGASDMSSWLLMGLPGLVCASGLRQIWVSIGLILGAYACWYLIAKRLRLYSEVANDSVTIPAFLDNRFRDHSKIIRGVAGLAILVFFTFYIAAGLYAGGVLLSLTFGIEYSTALLLGTAIIMLYTCIGGFLAVSWTDFFQGNFMLICLLLVPFFAIEQVGGWQAGMQKIALVNPNYLTLTEGLSFWKTVGLMGWGLGYFGMPHILVRFMAVKTVHEIPLARRVCIGWMSLSLIGAVLVGIVGAVHFAEVPLLNKETVFMDLSQEVFSPWIMGVILAAILSSSMCAIDSQMLAASSALTEDFYRAMFRHDASQQELMWIGRITVTVVAIIAIYIARKPSQSIMDLVTFAWAGLGATFGAAMIFSLYWKRATRNGIVAGMLAGGLTVIVWDFCGLGTSVYEIIPGFFLSILALVVVSFLDRKPSPEIVQEFEMVRKIATLH